MAETRGLVQKLKILPTGSVAYVYVGPSATNTTLLYISRSPNDSAAQGAFKNSMLDAISAALVNRREVVATHGDTDSQITDMRIDPL